MNRLTFGAILALLLPFSAIAADPVSYPIVGTGQSRCYNDRGPTFCPRATEPFYGQDAQQQAVRQPRQPHGCYADWRVPTICTDRGQAPSS